MVPLKFRAAVRSEIDQHYSDYSYRTTLGKKVTAIQPLTKGFRVFDDKGGKILVKKVILATGITDVVPNKPGFSEAFGRGLFWCPWCDGYDYRGRAMVVYGKPGKLSSAIGSAISLRKLTTNIQIITGGKITDEDKKAAEEKWPGWEKVIKTTYGIKVHEVDITKLERTAKGNEPSDDEYKLTLSGAPTTLVANGILYSTDTKQTSSLHKQLHLDMDGSSVKVSSNNMMTSVGGIYAVGDANNDGSTNAYHAMWSAKRAVVNAHGKWNKKFSYLLFEANRFSCTEQGGIP
jgi:thioredoxin reductase